MNWDRFWGLEPDWESLLAVEDSFICFFEHLGMGVSEPFHLWRMTRA